LNTYGYVGGNPVKYSDPLGLVEWTGEYSGGSLLVGGVYRYKLTSDCINGMQATVKVTAIGGGPSIDAAISAIGGKATFNDNLSNIDPSIFNGEFKSGDASFSIPPNGNMTAGMILGGAEPSTIANMNHGGSCGVTGLGGASSASCGGIRGLSIGIGVLYGGSFVTDVKWKKCGGECE
jgi:hypothetical protein